jgi:hypothetical protein
LDPLLPHPENADNDSPQKIAPAMPASTFISIPFDVPTPASYRSYATGFLGLFRALREFKPVTQKAENLPQVELSLRMRKASGK